MRIKGPEGTRLAFRSGALMWVTEHGKYYDWAVNEVLVTNRKLFIETMEMVGQCIATPLRVCSATPTFLTVFETDHLSPGTRVEVLERALVRYRSIKMYAYSFIHPTSGGSCWLDCNLLEPTRDTIPCPPPMFEEVSFGVD